MRLRPILALVRIGALVHLVYSWVVRPWHLEWGATLDEVRTSMPGDELVPHPTLCATRAMTIDAPPERVWPWLVQMGAYTRGGWYSYDWADNGGEPSADRIVPELQGLAVGDVMLTSRSEGFVVREIDPGHALVLVIDRTGRESPASRRFRPTPEVEPDSCSASERTSGLVTVSSDSSSTSAISC